MSIKKVCKDQPNEFELTIENLKIAENILNKYPIGREQSAVMDLYGSVFFKRALTDTEVHVFSQYLLNLFKI